MAASFNRRGHRRGGGRVRGAGGDAQPHHGDPADAHRGACGGPGCAGLVHAPVFPQRSGSLAGSRVRPGSVVPCSRGRRGDGLRVGFGASVSHLLPDGIHHQPGADGMDRVLAAIARRLGAGPGLVDRLHGHLADLPRPALQSVAVDSPVDVRLGGRRCGARLHARGGPGSMGRTAGRLGAGPGRLRRGIHLGQSHPFAAAGRADVQPPFGRDGQSQYDQRGTGPRRREDLPLSSGAVRVPAVPQGGRTPRGASVHHLQFPDPPRRGDAHHQAKRRLHRDARTAGPVRRGRIARAVRPVQLRVAGEEGRTADFRRRRDRRHADAVDAPAPGRYGTESPRNAGVVQPQRGRFALPPGVGRAGRTHAQPDRPLRDDPPGGLAGPEGTYRRPDCSPRPTAAGGRSSADPGR